VIPDTCVAIIGLGLMGGSLARAVSARGARVLGYDHNPACLDAALREGAVHQPLDTTFSALAEAEVVMLAIPVDASIALLPRIAGQLAAARLVMDVGSTKRSVVAAAESAGIGHRFVGAHPLTGSHRSGWGVSRASLFQDARVFLCPAASTASDTLQLAESFWRELRAGTEIMDADVHDVQMAWRSHLPHLLSSTLAMTLRDAGIRRSALGPGGRDMTRLAGGSPAMWTPIVEHNRLAIIDALSAYEAHLAALRESLERADPGAVHRFLVESVAWSDGDPLSPPA
jgi:prephenate dehydrogenase